MIGFQRTVLEVAIKAIEGPAKKPDSPYLSI